VITAINTARVDNPKNLQYDIVADPNYLTRLSDFTSDPCALPGDPGGSGGHPFGGPGTFDPKVYDIHKSKEAFKTQWAFGPDGINLSSISSTGLTGDDVRVGVFDTSPYRISFPFVKRVGEAFPSPLWFPNWDAGGTTMVSNHGLFVAELIHGIAPQSSIQLVRVLNEDGCGELWVLNKGLEAYKSRMSAWTEKLDKTVINMSLGIRLLTPEEDDDTGSEQDSPGSAENDSGPEEEPADTTAEAMGDENEDLETLKTLIDDAHDMGAIIIASAGNDSPGQDESGGTIDPMPMLVPASYPNVLGVAAIDNLKNRSCYSNSGDIAAPGGGGGQSLLDPTDSCVSRADTWDQPDGPNGGAPCTDPETCAYIVISLGVTSYGEQYIGWSGTSFAAPLVSGMAALAYEQMGKDRALCILGGGQSPITPPLTDPLGTGPINIGDFTNSTVLSNC
jgi:hypothetical protein